jgi:Chaperone of endosialidase
LVLKHFSNTEGLSNTAIGVQALQNNTTGDDNTATGTGALLSNVGAQNTANGSQALLSNTTGSENTAAGYQALLATTTGANNTGIGRQVLLSNITGGDNTAIGRDALVNNTTGSSNIAVGIGAGLFLTTGDNNIDIGNAGSGGEANTIRIGNGQTGAFVAGISGVPVTGTAVVVNIFGQLGVAPSSKRFKDDIKPMDKTSETLLGLKPVIFRYKKEIDPAGTPQFGLVAEDVEKVNPDLVVHDKQGKAYSVRYDQVNAMLLNEFLKAYCKLEEQDRKSYEQAATIAELKTEIASLAATVKDQTAQIQKVAAEVKTSKAAPQLVMTER